MNYEQKYKEALGWMKSQYGSFHGEYKEQAEHFFPELRESEDKRICGAILSCLNLLAEEDNVEKIGDVSISEMTDWIKRGPQCIGEVSGLVDKACELYIKYWQEGDFDPDAEEGSKIFRNRLNKFLKEFFYTWQDDTRL